MSKIDYLVVAKRREKLKKKYRIVKLFDVKLEPTYRVQERILFWWFDFKKVNFIGLIDTEDHKTIEPAIADMNEKIDKELNDWVKNKSVTPC